jgi:hypothetical protein
MSLKINVLMYQCFNVLPIEVVLMIVIFWQLAYAHEPKSKCHLKLNLCPSSISRSTRFGPMGFCNPVYNFATTFA